MKILTGIASTTHVDAHYDRLTREGLESGVEQIRSRFIPFLIDHDPNHQNDNSIGDRDVKKIRNFFELFPDKLQRLRDEYARMQR
jgi:hypothetical protein